MSTGSTRNGAKYYKTSWLVKSSGEYPKRSGKKADERYEESETDSESEFECHDTTEKNHYTPILTRPEEEIQAEAPVQIQAEDLNNNSGENIHTGQNPAVTEIETRKSKRTKKPPNRLGGVPYVKNFLG